MADSLGLEDVPVDGRHKGDIDLPEKYRVKRCKYCQAFSYDVSPLPGDQFPSWSPLIPWLDGKKTRPKGCICKICASVRNSFVQEASNNNCSIIRGKDD